MEERTRVKTKSKPVHSVTAEVAIATLKAALKMSMSLLRKGGFPDGSSKMKQLQAALDVASNISEPMMSAKAPKAIKGEEQQSVLLRCDRFPLTAKMKERLGLKESTEAT